VVLRLDPPRSAALASRAATLAYVHHVPNFFVVFLILFIILKLYFYGKNKKLNY